MHVVSYGDPTIQNVFWGDNKVMNDRNTHHFDSYYDDDDDDDCRPDCSSFTACFGNTDPSVCNWYDEEEDCEYDNYGEDD